MKVKITAVIKEIGQIEAFGQNNFQKRNLVLVHQNGEYENLFCVEFMKDNLTAPELYRVGQTVTVEAFLNCREYNGKYFTSLSGSSIQGEQATQPQQPQFGAQPQSPTYQTPQNVAPQQYQQPSTPQPVQQPQYNPQVQQPNYSQPQMPIQNN